ncbi:MAG: FKBP-type peptidyl-prolyl cis-trans isomerase [Epsilonproteobacteria bacterium]|nr:FKBP-type peptidyl-prolyl cis-trans isomerase [Campylobacterota bacterium]
MAATNTFKKEETMTQKNSDATTAAKSQKTSAPEAEFKPTPRTLDKTFKTASGLKYTVLQEPDSDALTVKPGDQVTVHYTGWLDNNGQPGKKFDSSVDRGRKFTFRAGVGQVIRGWDETLLSMKTGEKRRVTIPAELGYGARGAGAAIPPNASLIFDVELFDVKTPQPRAHRTA